MQHPRAGRWRQLTKHVQKLWRHTHLSHHPVAHPLALDQAVPGAEGGQACTQDGGGGNAACRRVQEGRAGRGSAGAFRCIERVSGCQATGVALGETSSSWFPTEGPAGCGHVRSPRREFASLTQKTERIISVGLVLGLHDAFVRSLGCCRDVLGRLGGRAAPAGWALLSAANRGHARLLDTGPAAASRAR